MNVKELRAELAKYPSNAMVVVRGYEQGVNEVDRIEPCNIALYVHTEWYYGQHERHDPGSSEFYDKLYSKNVQIKAIELIGEGLA